MANMSLSFHKSIDMRRKRRGEGFSMTEYGRRAVKNAVGSIVTYGLPNNSIGGYLRLDGSTQSIHVFFNLFAIKIVKINLS
tara:strand:+ start:790 stop:1032 length:243 start_codon:yes stop_codon:yes gene_type:complete